MKNRKFKLLVIVPIVLVGLYALLGFVAVPMIARSMIEKSLTQTLRGGGTLERARFNPFLFEATLENLSLNSPDRGPVIHAGKIEAEFTPSKLFSREGYLEYLRFTDLNVYDTLTSELMGEFPSIELRNAGYRWSDSQLSIGAITIGGGDTTLEEQSDRKLNFARIVDSLALIESAAPKQAPPASAPGASFNLSLGDVKLADHTISYTTLIDSEPVTWTLEKINMGVKNFRLYAGGKSSLVLSFTGKTGGSVNATGDFSVQPVSLDIKAGFSNLPLREINGFLKANDLKMNGGTLSADFAVRLEDKEEFVFAVTGDVTVAEPNLVKGESADAEFKAAALSLKQFSLNAVPFNFKAREFNLEKPAGRFRIGTAAAAPKTAAAEPQPLNRDRNLPDISVDKIAMNGGSFSLEDASVSPPVLQELTDIGGEIVPFSLSGTGPSRINLKAVAQKEAPLKVQATTVLGAFPDGTEIKVTLDRLPLKSYSAYSGRFLGRNIDEGKLSADLAAQCKGTHVAGENTIRLQKVTFGKNVESKDAIQVPIETVLSLMSDSKGVVTLDLPVEGESSDPSFRYYRVLGAAFQNTMLEVVASPITMLAGLYDWGGADTQAIHFSKQSADLTEPELKKLDLLARVLQEKPMLELEIFGGSSAAEFEDGDEVEPRDELARTRASKIKEYLASRGAKLNRLYTANINANQSFAAEGVSSQLKLSLAD